MIYLTSDLHFAHSRPFLYEPRGFNSIEEHDNAIIERWNSIVTPSDTVFILGDIMLNDNEKGIINLMKLNGYKHIIRGNHDTDSRWDVYQTCPATDTIGYATMIKYHKYHFYLSHYPTLTANADDKGLKHCVLNLHGHTHSKKKFYNENPMMYNVALDAHNCYPVSIEQIIQDMKEQKEKINETN